MDGQPAAFLESNCFPVSFKDKKSFKLTDEHIFIKHLFQVGYLLQN